MLVPKFLLCQATDLTGEDGQPVGVEVQLGELAQLLDGRRHVRDVGLGQVQPRLVLLLALGKLTRQVLRVSHVTLVQQAQDLFYIPVWW